MVGRAETMKRRVVRGTHEDLASGCFYERSLSFQLRRPDVTDSIKSGTSNTYERTLSFTRKCRRKLGTMAGYSFEKQGSERV